MKKITLAKTAGFCFGVDNAIKKLDNAVKYMDSPIYTLGPIIHNKQMIEKYDSQNVKIINDLSQIENNATVVIRSHGIAKSFYDDMMQKHINIIDATCPYVKKVQDIVSKYYLQGYKIIIIGDEKHPEVIGVNGWCNNSAIIINNKNNIPIIKMYDKICVVAQTTIIENLFLEIVSEIQKLNCETQVFNTICSATEERQEEAKFLAKNSDAMIVIGGYDSSNTKKLTEICKKYCDNVVHIETASEIDINKFKDCKSVGITAGASTPAWIIKEVVQKV